METINNNPEATQASTETTQGEQTPVVAEQGQSTQPEGTLDTGIQAQVQPTPYTPDFKIKVRKQEYEIPEMYRGLMTDEQKAEEVRKTFAKAYGLEHVQSHRDQLQNEFHQFRSQAEPVLQLKQQFEYFKGKGDLTNALQVLGITKQEAWKWALEEADRQNLPEAQRQVYNQQEQAQLQAWQLEQELQKRDQQLIEFQVHQRTTELENTLSQPDITSFAQAFDSNPANKADGITFRDEVIARGQWYWDRFNQDVPPAQLAKELMSRYQIGQASSQQVAPPQMGNQQQPTQQQAGQQKKSIPVIPNTGAGQIAPVKKKPRTIAEMQEMAKSLED